MGDITTGDLLQMQEIIRDDIKECKSDLSKKIDDVRETQDKHGERLSALERQASGIGLTKAQKTALWTGATGLAIEGLRHLKSLIFGLLWIVRGVRL